MEISNILTPQTWAEVYDALFEGTYNSRLNRFKSRFAYRGVSSDKYDTKTSLMRLGGEYSKVENHLLRQFKKYAYKYIEDKHDDWYWLSVAQHYGLPTRLLDWSYSPEVALHFATCNTEKFDSDGAVWKVNYKKVHESLPPVLLGHVKQENTWILTVDILERMFKNLEELDGFGRKGKDFVIFFEPPAIDERIYNQYAYFSVCSNPELLIDQWLLEHPDFWQKVIIPKELKWEIRDKLDQNNISERTLFPGMSGLADWLKRYYLPTGSAVKGQ